MVRVQRERMLAAVVEVVGEIGYSQMTVQDVITRAGVSRRTFYEHFSNKEDVFLAAYDHVVDLVLAEVSASYETGQTFVERVRLGLEAFVDYLAAQPALAHVCVVEVLAAGPKALARRSVAMQRFRAFVAPGFDESPPATRAPDITADAVIGGIYEVIYDHVLRGETGLLPRRSSELLHGVLVPFVGLEAASRASQAAARAQRRSPQPS
ncbi:MAG: TetR/AcrR family transcriptional regulator [Thermoleophilaceae bacterium]